VPNVALTRRTRAGVTSTLTISFAAAAYALSIQVGTATGRTKVIEISLGVIFTVLTGALPSYEQYRQIRERRTAERLAADAQSQLRVAIGDALEPVTGLLADLARAKGLAKTTLRGQSIQALLNCAAGVVGTDRARACFFRLASDPQRLVPQEHAGRSSRPRTTFLAGNPDGDAALAMVNSRQRRYCLDVATDPPPGWSGTTSGYSTFVSVPVWAGAEPLGMLTVDALAPGDLADEEGSGLVDVFANLLGAILSV